MFDDSIKFKLNITAGGSFDIPGANVKNVKARIDSYGFTCRLNFWVYNEQKTDELLAKFILNDLIEAKLDILPFFPPEDGSTVETLTLKGLVTSKRILDEFVSTNIYVSGNPVLCRWYEIEFADEAAVLWTQHFPCELMVDKTVKDVLDAHKGRVKLTCQWDVLTVKHAINALPLGVDGSECSFYDFVMWYVSENDGVWTYDTVENTYTLSAEKAEGGQAVKINTLNVETIRVDFPETIRYKINLLNAYSENPQKKPISQDQAVAGVFHDMIGRFPVSSDFDALSTLETKKLRIREHELLMTFKRYPLLTFRPGTLIKIEGFQWSPTLFSYGKEYRVRSMVIDASAADQNPDADHNMPFAKYHIGMEAQMETKAELDVSLPTFKPPLYPLRVEGKIVSEQGQENEETYQFYTDAVTSLDQYKVEIPLFDNQKAVVPYEPNFFSGHFYFPMYKRARVLVALDLHAGRILRCLDWRVNCRLTMDTQGNHILFGKRDASKTSVQHKYVNEKPEFHVTRLCEKDTQILSITEGVMVLETKEEL